MAPSGFSPSMPATGGCARSLCPLHCNQKLRKGSAGLPRFRNGSNRSHASIKICWKNAKSAEALFFELFIFHPLSERSPPPYAPSPGPFLCSTPARLPVLLHTAQFRLLLGFDLRLDPLFRPPLSHPHHSIRPTHRFQTLLLLPSLLQPSPLEPRRSGPLCLPTAVTVLCRHLGRRRRRHPGP